MSVTGKMQFLCSERWHHKGLWSYTYWMEKSLFLESKELVAMEMNNAQHSTEQFLISERNLMMEDFLGEECPLVCQFCLQVCLFCLCGRRRARWSHTGNCVTVQLPLIWLEKLFSRKSVVEMLVMAESCLWKVWAGGVLVLLVPPWVFGKFGSLIYRDVIRKETQSLKHAQEEIITSPVSKKRYCVFDHQPLWMIWCAKKALHELSCYWTQSHTLPVLTCLHELKSWLSVYLWLVLCEWVTRMGLWLVNELLEQVCALWMSP